MIETIGDLVLERGGVLRGAELAYVTYGELAPDRDNAVLLTHGYTSSHLFADPAASSDGGWGELVGPGRAIDTDRTFVISSNMLGSSYGSTGPRSIDPASGRAYGPDFPVLTVGDIVAAQRRLIDRLGVRELAAVIGPSYGGFQALAWGVAFPDLVRVLVPVVTAPRTGGALDLDGLRRRLSADPGWNGGRCDAAAILGTMTAVRVETLVRYGMEAVMADRGMGQAERAAALESMARDWARSFDAQSLLVLGAAANEFDVTPLLSRIRAPVLFVLSATDALFPPRLGPTVMAALRAAGVQATYHEIDSRYGHLAPGLDAARWAPVLARFLAPT
ncbi:MAG TPA: alpha/beta fold hydrolase [Kofleriaceae bacterium]|nr:alpha/beta fold hydrolase [Kofleriaceae bacterium]